MAPWVVTTDGSARVEGGSLAAEISATVAGAAVIGPTGALPDGESDGLAATLPAAYAELGAIPSIWEASLDGAEQTVVFPAPTPGDAAVVFLHGYGGALSWPCGQVAVAANGAGFTAVCPALDLAGDWWGAEGERRIDLTLDWLEAAGYRHVVLAGLSNGGIGASRVAARFAPRLDGLVLISGASSSGSTGGLPTLILHGDADKMTSVASARSLRGPGVTVVEVPSDHFAFLRLRAPLTAQLTGWLAGQRAGW